jgi:hypothetical protein
VGVGVVGVVGVGVGVVGEVGVVDPGLVATGGAALVEVPPPPPPQADNVSSAAKALANRRIEGAGAGEKDGELMHSIICSAYLRTISEYKNATFFILTMPPVLLPCDWRPAGMRLRDIYRARIRVDSG